MLLSNLNLSYHKLYKLLNTIQFQVLKSIIFVLIKIDRECIYWIKLLILVKIISSVETYIFFKLCNDNFTKVYNYEINYMRVINIATDFTI